MKVFCYKMGPMWGPGAWGPRGNPWGGPRGNFFKSIRVPLEIGFYR